MTTKTLRSGNKEVMQFMTPSGVIGTVATSIPREALAGWAESLEARLRELERLDKLPAPSAKRRRQKP